MVKGVLNSTLAINRILFLADQFDSMAEFLRLRHDVSSVESFRITSHEIVLVLQILLTAKVIISRNFLILRNAFIPWFTDISCKFVEMEAHNRISAAEAVSATKRFVSDHRASPVARLADVEAVVLLVRISAIITFTILTSAWVSSSLV